MAEIFDVDPNILIEKTAERLKSVSEIKPPEWSSFVKTGMAKQRPPVRNDWWYVRAAAVLRSIYSMGPIGTNTLRRKYGGRKNRGHKPEHFYPAYGSIIRKILQQLEKAKLIQQAAKGIHKGRVLTPQGKSLIDKVAVGLAKSRPKKAFEKVDVIKPEPVVQQQEPPRKTEEAFRPRRPRRQFEKRRERR